MPGDGNQESPHTSQPPQHSWSCCKHPTSRIYDFFDPVILPISCSLENFDYFYMAIYDLASFAYKSMSRYVSSKESVQKSSNIKTAAAADWKFNNLDAINIFPGKISIALSCLHGALAQFRGCCKKLHENWRKPHLNVIIPQCHQIWRGHVSCLLPHVATSGDTRGWRGLTSSRYISEKIGNIHQYTWKIKKSWTSESSIIYLLSVQIYIQELHDRINLA